MQLRRAFRRYRHDHHHRPLNSFVRRKAIQSPIDFRRFVRTILAFAVAVLCMLIIVAALIRPDAGFERLLPLVIGLMAVVVDYYFRRRQ